jgi:hypothetical protein
MQQPTTVALLVSVISYPFLDSLALLGLFILKLVKPGFVRLLDIIGNLESIIEMAKTKQCEILVNNIRLHQYSARTSPMAIGAVLLWIRDPVRFARFYVVVVPANPSSIPTLERFIVEIERFAGAREFNLRNPSWTIVVKTGF